MVESKWRQSAPFYYFFYFYFYYSIGRINSLCRHLKGKYANRWGSLKKYHIGLGWCLAQYDFFKDPIYFCISPLSVYITNIITATWSEVLDHIKLTGTDHQIKQDAERRVWSGGPGLVMRCDLALRIKLL